MNILLIGSGGREHAMAWKIAQSPLLGELFIAPGNAGIATTGTCIELDVSDHDAVIDFSHGNNIELVVIGPEAPLVEGLSDSLNEAGIACFGPSAYAAQLEGSKGFTKDLCAENGIPTAKYARFTDEQAAKEYVEAEGAPIVVKADGLAAGKGVIMATTIEKALAAIAECFSGSFGDAGQELVIEEMLYGEEASFFALSDGETILPLATAQDHKRVFDGDQGPNTGGMGAYSPAPVLTPELIEQTINEIIKPTVAAMSERGHPYKGVLYAGLMITEKGPELIEYNARFGDPECQVLMMRLKSDLVPALIATATGNLNDIQLEWHENPALTVVMASNGYPGSYEKGTIINGLENAANDADIEVFHAGTALENNQIIAIGGRVLNVTARGETIRAAQAKAYDAISKIDWPGGFNRKDIGWRAIESEN